MINTLRKTWRWKLFLGNELAHSNDQRQAVAYSIFHTAERELGKHADMLTLVHWVFSEVIDERLSVLTLSHKNAHYKIDVPVQILRGEDMFPAEFALEHGKLFAAWLLLQASARQPDEIQAPN